MIGTLSSPLEGGDESWNLGDWPFELGLNYDSLNLGTTARRLRRVAYRVIDIIQVSPEQSGILWGEAEEGAVHSLGRMAMLRPLPNSQN